MPKLFVSTRAVLILRSDRRANFHDLVEEVSERLQQIHGKSFEDLGKWVAIKRGQQDLTMLSVQAYTFNLEEYNNPSDRTLIESEAAQVLRRSEVKSAAGVCPSGDSTAVPGGPWDQKRAHQCLIKNRQNLLAFLEETSEKLIGTPLSSLNAKKEYLKIRRDEIRRWKHLR